MTVNNWQTQILTPQAKLLLPKLASTALINKFYLAGGTALSLYLGHRESVDFDFFTNEEFSANIIDQFKPLSNELKVISRHDNSVEFFLGGVKFFFWLYLYPLTQPLNDFNGIKIASPVDIGLMKIIALEGRVAWKDIIDLYYLDQEVISIADLAKLFYQTYPQNEFNEYSRLKVLLNEKELAASPKPKLLKQVDLEQIKEHVYSKLLQEFKNNIRLAQGQ